MPEVGDTEHPVIVQVNEGAPDSATLTVIVMVTEAAWTGNGGKASKTASTVAVASKTPTLLGSKRLGRLPYPCSERYLVLGFRTSELPKPGTVC